jgi:hypothetical protein
LCFSRKPEFEAGNHAAKRRIAAEIVAITRSLPGRFLKRANEKACQVMRDFQRPDRLAIREMAMANGARKRQRTSESTPAIVAVRFHQNRFISYLTKVFLSFDNRFSKLSRLLMFNYPL